MHQHVSTQRVNADLHQLVSLLLLLLLLLWI
jgi:hypothetical protein